MQALIKVYTQMEEHHASIMGRTPHWYLWYFGTDPNCTGELNHCSRREHPIHTPALLHSCFVTLSNLREPNRDCHAVAVCARAYSA